MFNKIITNIIFAKCQLWTPVALNDYLRGERRRNGQNAPTHSIANFLFLHAVAEDSFLSAHSFSQQKAPAICILSILGYRKHMEFLSRPYFLALKIYAWAAPTFICPTSSFCQLSPTSFSTYVQCNTGSSLIFNKEDFVQSMKYSPYAFTMSNDG